MIKTFSKSIRRKSFQIVGLVLSLTLISNFLYPIPAKSQHASDIPDDALAYGFAGQLDLRLLEGLLSGDGLSIAELSGTDQSWTHNSTSSSPDPQDPNEHNLQVGVLDNAVDLNLGAIPLHLVGQSGLLEFVLNEAELGLIGERANARTPNEAYGAVGLLGSDGAVDLTKGGAGDAYAKVDLISLLSLGQSEVFTSTLIDDASLQLGVLGSKAERHDIDDAAAAICEGMNQVDFDTLNHPDLSNGLFGDPYFTVSPELMTEPGKDDLKFCTDYRIADAKIVIDAPLVKNLMATIEEVLGTVDSLINTAVGEDGVLDSVLSAVGGILTGTLGLLNTILSILGISVLEKLDLSVTAEIPITDIMDTLKATELSDENGFVSINLGAGTIEVDLQQLHGGDLSNLAPNTPLLTSTQVELIASTITSLLTAPKAENPDGLMAALDNILRGDPNTQTGGLYETSVRIFLELDALSAPLVGSLAGGTLKISGTLGAILGDSDDLVIEGTGTLALVSVLGKLVAALTGGIGPILEGLLFSEPSIVSSVVGSVGSSALVNNLLTTLDPLLQMVLMPLANAIINRQTVEKVDQGTLFTVSALELNVLTLGGNPTTQQTEDRLIGLPIATSAVLAQQWDLIDLDINVVKIGDGRGLHASGYTYNLVCEAPRWTGIEATGDDALNYSAGNVGTSFKFNSGSLSLDGATGGLATKVEVLPGSTCTITAAPELASNSYLRPTGDTPARTPYTYFLEANGTNVLVSDEPDADGITETTTSGVTIDANNDVLVDASVVGDKWKNHSFTFVIPEDATVYTVNVVHAYEIDQRDVVVKKIVEAADPTAVGPFDFQYSVNGGAWVAPASPIIGGEFFTIENVPLIDGTSLAETQIAVRETITAPENDGPTVTWVFSDPDEDLTATHDGTYSTTNQFSVTLGITETSTTTPVLELTAKNSYPVNVNFEAMLPKTGQTTLVWVIGLGLLTALGAVIMYVRSRKQ